MAYAALTSLAGVIDRNLQQDEKYVSICTKDQMIFLHENVSLLQEFLEECFSKSFLPEDIDVFESRIIDTAYKMEDTIELVILTEPGKVAETDEQIPTQDEFSCYFEEVLILLEEAMDMQKTINNNSISEALHPLSTTTSSSREAPGSKGTKVGLDKALNQILDQVTRQGSMLQIVPITGMGGIGKTTLARAAYEAPHTRDHFDILHWVTISQEENVQNILRGVLLEAERTQLPDEQLIEHVHKRLKCRRYLIVLDDMWDEKVWDRVRNAFPDDNKGSRIILTTRLSGVASYVGSSSSVHEMQFLNEDQSWELLRENVYGHERHLSTEFEGIGRMIARNCKGLPLAVVVIAGILKFNKTIDYWSQVARNSNEKAITRDGYLFKILCWSYTRLPPHLKACFLYMGLYKEDDDIPTKELVRLWASEGFLKPKHSRSMEEVAEECLEELVERSLVLVTKRWYNGKIRTCSVHDVIREVSIRKAEEEKFHYHSPSSYLDESTLKNILTVHRRVSITKCYRYNFRLPHDTFSATTRSLIDQSIYDDSMSMSIVQYFKLLRVLNKAYIEEDSQLTCLCTLTNLRYLDICYDIRSDITNIVPESISKLHNLETLIVRTGWDISISFPQEIWKLRRLRHIVVMQGVDVEFPVPDQGCPSLQTLSGVTNFNITRSLSEIFPYLKIMKLNYIDDGQEYSMESLQYLYQLEVLSIGAPHRPSQLINFVFPQNIKKLTLFGTYIPLENLSPIGLLPNLKVLKLKEYSVSGEEWEPVEGEFLQLEHLKMEYLFLKHWRAESIHFPRLRKLVIISRLLEEVPESIGEIDTLETLIVGVLEEEAIRSVQKIKENQQDFCNHLLQVIILDWK